MDWQRAGRHLVVAVAAGGLAGGGAASAQTPIPAAPVTQPGAAGSVPGFVGLPAGGAALALPPVETVGQAPLPGYGLPLDRIPGNARSIGADEIGLEGRPELPATLERLSGSIVRNEAQANPFQPDVQYRGFNASPLVGTPQGLAVYQNGVRLNQSFGDTVSWDLIPESAIRSVDLVGSNPVFGLNAVGGAIALRMKTGFDYQGTEINGSVGAFGRTFLGVQSGARFGNAATYLAIEGLNEDGWRRFSPSQLRRLYGDLSFRGERARLGLSVTAATNRLTGNGTIPVEVFRADRRAVFTYPDQTYNQSLTLQANGAFDLTDRVSLETTAYVRRFRQRTLNADAAEVEECEDDPALEDLLCLENGQPLQTTAGLLLGEDVLRDGPGAGVVNRTRTSTTAYGASAQVVSAEPLLGRPNRFVAGASYDRGRTRFGATTELGLPTPDRSVAGLGLLLDLPDGDIAPVELRATNDYSGFYVSNTLDLLPRLSATVGARFNVAHVNLLDQLGDDLNGSHRFSRLNPAGGLTWRPLDGLTVYGGYAEANRAPTPAELSCADPDRPCTLAAFFVADPPLKQVVSRTVEAGVRGDLSGPNAVFGGRLTWNAGVFRADLSDDILLVASQTRGRGYFQNAGDTRREGIEAGIGWRGARVNASVDYSFIDATFRDAVVLPGAGNPGEAEDGTITTRRGNQLPNIPRNRVRGNLDWRVLPVWSVGGSVSYTGSQYFRGDEANFVKPLGDFFTVDLRTSWQVGRGVEIYGLVRNLFDRRYGTFAALTETDGAEAFGLTLNDPRTLSPGLPRAVYGGVRVRF